MTFLQTGAMAILALAIAIPIGTARADYNIKTIGNCQTIFESGSYALDKVIRATESDMVQGVFPGGVCIYINASFVTLDLNGYSIIGPGGTAVSMGVYGQQGRQNINVQSGHVMGFHTGVRLDTRNSTIERINASANTQFGIVAGGPTTATGLRVVGNTANNNGFVGIQVNCPSVVLDNIATGNGTGVFDLFAPPALCTRLGNFPAP